MYTNSKGFLDQYTRVVWVYFPTWNIRNVWRVRDDGHHYDVTSKCCGVTITTRLVEWMRCLSPRFVYSFAVFKNCQALKIQMVTQIKCGIKAWAVDIAQLTHHEVQGGGKNPETEGRGIFATTADRLQCQPMESRFWDGLLCYNTQRCELNVHAKTTMMHFISMFNNEIINE